MTEFQIEVLSIWSISFAIGILPTMTLAFFLQKDNRMETFVILSALCLVGASAGITGGYSREPAVGAIIPAFLGMLSGVVLYLFGVERSRGLIASFATASLALSLIVSYMLASEERYFTEEFLDGRELCSKAFTNADLIGSEEAYKRFWNRYGKLCDATHGWELED